MNSGSPVIPSGSKRWCSSRSQICRIGVPYWSASLDKVAAGYNDRIKHMGAEKEIEIMTI